MGFLQTLLKNKIWLFPAIIFTAFTLHFSGFEGSFLSPDASWASEEAAPAAEGGETAEEESPYPPAPKLEEKDYPQYAFNSRAAIWIVSQLHLYFAAFVLGVPIFVLIIELMGHLGGDRRYDKMAYEFIKIAMTAFSLTASFGGVLAFMLIGFYPDFFKYMAGIFGDTMIIYALLFFGESFFLYVYYYGWNALDDGGNKKWVHLTCGLMLNVFGMTLMVLSNSWVTFMMAPSGIDLETGVFAGNVWACIKGFLWNPVNLHRFIANIAYGGSIVGAYAAYKFISAKAQEDKAHYDWMGYTANIICIVGLLPLPFAGYWLTAEVYSYSQQMGITLMGGVFAWLFIIQAVLIGAIFLSCNYYLWCGMGRSEGAKRYTPYVKYIATAVVFCFLIWFTPHTLVMTSHEQTLVGGTHHPVLGVLGVMSAKNTAVNIMILATFLSFQLYRRSNIESTVSWAPLGNGLIVGLYVAGVANIIWLGVYGYLIPAGVRIGLSVPQVFTTLLVVIICSIIEAFMYKNPKQVGELQWGKMPVRSQYALFVLAVSFTWLMGLMGYCRSAIRQHWHVYTVFRDNSPDAFTPTLGYAANMVSLTVVIFMALVIFVFWLSAFASKKAVKA